MLPILFGLLSNAGGIVAEFGAGFHAKDNAESVEMARIVAFIGGAWCAFTWFGWPFVTETVFVGLGFQPLEVVEFSILRLIGLVLFGGIGVGIFESIIDGDE